MFMGFCALAGFCLVLILVVMMTVAYLRRMVRASALGHGWVKMVPRVAFPLLAGCVFTRWVFGADTLAQEMDGWYTALNTVAIILGGVGAAHLAARVRHSTSGDRAIALGLLALIAGTIASAFVLLALI